MDSREHKALKALRLLADAYSLQLEDTSPCDPEDVVAHYLSQAGENDPLIVLSRQRVAVLCDDLECGRMYIEDLGPAMVDPLPRSQQRGRG